MSWRAIDDERILAELLTHRVLGVRFVLFDVGDEDVARAAESPAAAVSVQVGRRYELHVMETDPGSALVWDTSDRAVPVGAYVWAGGGRPVESSRDPRVVQLADALESEYRGAGEPPSFSADGPDLPGVGDAVDIGEPGVRSTLDRMSVDQLLDLAETHCTDAQCRQVKRMFKHGAQWMNLVNLRVRGGPAIGEVCPVVVDKFDQQWVVFPNGVADRLGDDE